MIETLTLLLFNSLYIIGLWNSTDYSIETSVEGIERYKEGEILGKLGYHTRNLPSWLKKPLLDCVICMASIHSYPFWLINDFTLLNGCIWILYIFALSGLNLIIYERVTNRG